METHGEPAGPLTVHYSGACPICAAEMDHYRRRDVKGALRLVDVSTEPEEAGALGIDCDTALRRLHAVTPEGEVHRGLEAFLAIWRRLPGYGGMARLFSLPGIRQLSAWGYEHVVAAVIYRWSKARMARRARAAASD